MNDVRTGELLEHLAHQVRLAAGAKGAIGHLAALRIRGQLFQVLGRCVGTDHQRQRHVSDRRHRHEVALHVVRQRGEQHRVEHEGRVVGEKQRVAVCWRLGNGIGTDGGVGTGAVLDHDRLAQGLGELLAHAPTDDVGGAAWRVRDDDADRLGREDALREGMRGKPRQDSCASGGNDLASGCHLGLLFIRGWRQRRSWANRRRSRGCVLPAPAGP